MFRFGFAEKGVRELCELAKHVEKDGNINKNIPKHNININNEQT